MGIFRTSAVIMRFFSVVSIQSYNRKENAVADLEMITFYEEI